MGFDANQRRRRRKKRTTFEFSFLSSNFDLTSIYDSFNFANAQQSQKYVFALINNISPNLHLERCDWSLSSPAASATPTGRTLMGFHARQRHRRRQESLFLSFGFVLKR